MLKQGMGKNSCLVFIFIFCFHCYAIVGVELGDTAAEIPGNGETQLSNTTLPPIIDLCYSNPCINGGSCSMDGSSFKCDCGVGLTGNICETAIGECIPPDPTNGCPPQSDCAVTPNGNVCVCRGNFKGKKCDIADKLITCTKDLAIRYAPSIDRRPTSVKCFKTRTTDDDPCTDPDDPTQYELVAGVDSPGVTLLPEDSEGRVCLQLDFRDRPFPGDKLCVDVAAFEKDDIVLRPWRNATMHVCISLDHSPTIDLIPQVTYNVADETSWKNSWYILASDSDNDALTYSINATVPDGYLDYFNVESTTGKVTLVTTPSITDWLLVTLTVLVSQLNNPNQAAVAQAEVHFYNFSITCSQDDIIIGLNNQQDSAIGQIQCTSSMNEDLTYNYVNPLSEYENIFVSENGALSLRSPLTDPGTHYVMVLVKGTLVINNRNNILADNSLSGVESLVAQSEVKFNLIAGYFEPTCDIFEASFSEDTTVGTCNDISVCSSKTYGNTPVCTTTDVSILFETNCKPLTDSDIAGIATTVCSVADLKGNAGEFHVNLSVSNEYGMTELSVPFTVLPSEENVPPTFLNTPYAVSVYEDNEVGSSIFTDYYTDPDEGDTFTIYITDDITQFSVSISEATKSFSLILAEKLNVASIDSYEFSLAIRDSAGGSAQTSVVVSVLDVNEPPVCTRLPLLTLDDPQPMVTEIATVQCSDLDVKTEFSTLTYALDGLETESFTIDDKGILYAAANLATEPSIYVFYVIVADGGGLDATVTVTVIINYVCEPGQSSDTGRVPCTDCPQGQYQDKPGQTDCVDCPSQQRTPNSGSTSVVECIGGCSPGQYSSTGYAPCLQCPLGEYQSSPAQTQCIGCPRSKTTVETGSDSEDFCIATMTFGRRRKADVFPPSCEKDGLEVEISEESPPGSCYSIATSCTDPQNSPSDLTYDLSDPSKLFELGEEIGASTIEICHVGSLQGSSSNWNVNLTISNAYGSKWIMLVVTVSNVLHLPVFSSSQYNISVKENAEIGTEVLTVEATDVDLVGNLLFSLEGDAAFVIDSTTGVVTVAETLDAAKLYELTVSVKDTEEALSSATATVVVTVIDVNVPPICPEAVSLNLDITAAVGFLVGTVDCIDNDVLEEYKTITYSISGPESENFAVGLETGDITTKAILVGGPSLYEFTITAADGGKLSSVVAVSVSLNTDYQPTCEAETVSKKIYEDVTDCFPVDVVCNDPLNEAAALNFILTDNLELFTVGDSEAGVNNLVLCPKVKLKPDTLNLNINVTSKYGFTLIMVVIEILDVNEPPRFLEETYQADIEETLPVGSSLSLIVSATDDDTGEYGVLQYSTDSVDFSISDGSLFLQTILNATAVDFYRFIVTAEDGGGLSTTTIVEISVIDINEPPTCPGDIEVKLDLTTAIETLIGKTGCYDADKETDYRTIVYDYNQKEAGPLSVTNNGEIYVSGIISKELTSYVFPLRVLDKEMQINEESGITVDVSVVVNANFPPKCSDTELSAEVQEDEIVNRYCLTSVVTCSDPTGGVLTIESEEGDGRNLMAVMSRTVETSKDLLLNLCLQNSPAQQFGTYTVTVTLSNGIGETTVTWTFSVIDVNDSPKFSQSSYNVSIPETSEVGSAILSISASDKDTANDFAIVGIAAEIIGEQSSDISFHEGCSCFKVDVQLNATFRSVYEFQLEVVDGGGLTDMATVTITVNDVNENPECDNSPLLLSTNILAEVGKNLGSLNCHDYDLDPENKELTYTTSGSDAEYFEVTGDGEVVIAKTLPRLSQSLTFMVIISDNAVDSRRTSVMVEVSVDNAFPAKCSPSFRYPDKWVIGSCLELSLNCEDETMTDTDHLTNFLSGNYTTGFEKTSDDNADPIVLCYKLDMTSETFVITVEVNNELGTFEYTAYIVVEYMASTPTFDMTVYIVNISETTGAESEVVTVTATASSEGTIVYSILGSSSMPRWQEFFSIDSQGTVTTVKSVAELVTETVVLAVEAVDDISELKSTVNVEITVFDVNEPPSCDIGDVNVTIELISNVGYPLKMFNCSDPDVSARNKRLVFNMGENDVNSQYFEIVESDASVKIKVRSKLPVDRSKYKLLIEVSDMGDPPESLSYTIHVTVNLMPSAPLVAATVLDSHTVLVEWSYVRVEFLDITTKFLLIIRSGDSEVRKLDFPHDQSSVKVDSLSPETTYVISVAGYVRKGLSPPGTVTIKTTGVSVITKMVASMRFPDEIYMSSFGDENSVAFSEEKQKIIDNLSPIFQKQSGFESVDVVSLRQGSVIADTVISINQNGNMTDTRTTLQQTVSSGWIGKFTVDPTYLITEDGDGYVSVTSLESSDATLSDGSNVMFTCHVDTIGNTGQVKFSWLWRGVLVQPLNSRINITHDLSNYKAVGYLTFNPIMKKDDGSLVCSVQSEDGTMVSQEDIQINVFVKPTVTLYPMSWSLMMDKSVILTCTADRDADILWYLNDETFSEPADIEIIKVSDKQEKLLIKRLESMIHISCEAIVDKETGPRATATVGVIAGKDGLDPIYCPTSTDRREMLWDMTMPGLQSMKDCPNGLRGTVLRMCSSDGEWKEADYDGCVSQMIQDVMNQLAAMMDGLSDVTIEDTLNDMASATDSHELVTGELQKTAEILAEIIIIEKMMDEIIEEDVLGKFVEVASNVIGEQNKGEFYVLLQQQEDGNKTGASSIMKVVSEFSEMTSAKFPDNDHSKIISKKNIVVEFGKSKPKELKFPDGEKKEYPSWIKTSSNGLILNKEAIVSSLGSESNVSFSSVFYRNMSSIVHIYQESEIENEEHENVTVNSDILSLTLTPHPANLDPPLQITFEHISKNFSNPKCSYWKFQVPNTPNGAWSTSGCSLKSSSDRVTVCECYHLTNFAILMSPVVTPIVHALPLSIISAVGCAISLLCLLMTIGAHLFLWRYVKSDRTIILMNLCVALLIAYVLFIAGVDRTENKAICTVIAALLHYFYLVVFFLMLAEGIEIAFTVLYVFSIKSRIKWMIPLAWAIPAMIVGLSLGITQLTGYGNSQFCWLSVDDALIFAFIGPALVVILINLVIISAAFNAMFKTSVMLTKSAKQQAKTGLRSLCILLPVMGLTWVFGVFSVNEDLVFFQYLFAICNSFQGLFIFIFHCVLSRQVQEGIAHKRRRKKSLAEFSSRSTTRGSPIKSRDSDSSVVLEKKVSPFLVVDRQVHEMARKLKMSTDEHNLEDSNVRKDDNVRLVSLDDVKILNLSEMTKTPLGPSASDNPSMQTTSTTTEPPKSPHLHDEEIERNDKLNDLDKNYQDYKSYLEPNIPPAQIHFPDSLQHQQTKRLDKKLQRKPYTKCDSEGPVGKHMSTNNISEPASPVFQNPVYPIEKVDEIHPSRSTMSRISETVRDSLYMTPVGEDSEEVEMRNSHHHYLRNTDNPKKKLQESQERLKSVYSNSNDAFSHEIQGKEPRRERKLEKNHSYSSRDSRKMQEKYGSKSKQTAAAKQKHGRSRDQLQGYEYEYEYEYVPSEYVPSEYVPSEPQTYMEDYSAEYMEYHPYGGIRSGTRSRYPRSEGYNSQFNYPWGDQYVEYW